MKRLANRTRVLILLKKIRILLKYRKNWVQGREAVNLGNIAVSPKSPEAVRFDILGAIEKFSTGNTARSLIQILLKHLPKTSPIYPKNPQKLRIAEYNDTRQHRTILRFLDKIKNKISP